MAGKLSGAIYSGGNDILHSVVHSRLIIAFCCGSRPSIAPALRGHYYILFHMLVLVIVVKNVFYVFFYFSIKKTSRYTSQTMQDIAIVTMEGEQETAPKLLSGTTFNDME